MPITKPSVQRPWAEGGTKTAPSDGRRNTGYVLNDIPTRAELNALLFEVTEAYRYLMKTGVSTWDANESYGLDDLAKDPADGNVYQLRNLTGLSSSTLPSNAPANWFPYGMRLQPSLLDYANPLFTFRDAQARQRSGIDHYGMPAGPIRYWQENWDRDTSAIFGAGSKWTLSSLSSGAAITNRGLSSDALDADTFRTLRLQPGTTIDNSVNVVEAFPCIRIDTQTLVVVEFKVAIDTVGANNHNVQFGITDAWSGGTRGLVVGKSQDDTNWQLFSAEHGGMLDTGIPPVANTYQRFRLEILGSSVVDTGSTYRVNLFINGAPFHVDSPITPAGAGPENLKIVFGATRTTTGGPTLRASFGPIDYRQHMFPLSGSAVY